MHIAPPRRAGRSEIETGQCSLDENWISRSGCMTSLGPLLKKRVSVVVIAGLYLWLYSTLYSLLFLYLAAGHWLAAGFDCGQMYQVMNVIVLELS